MNVLEQGIVDQGLIVSTPSFVHLISEVFQYGIGQSNGDLRLPGSRFDDSAPLGARKLDVAITLTCGFLHSASSGVGSLSTPRSGV